MASSSHPLAISSRRVVTPEGLFDAAVLVREGIIEAIVPSTGVPDELVRHDYGELVVMAGLVDSHVHINEPGRTEWEGFWTATRAAAAGGVTTLVDMPLNSTPVTTSTTSLDQKLRAAADRLFVDCGFYGGLVPGGIPEIEGLVGQGVFGIKAFLIDSGIEDFPPVDTDTLEAAMIVIAKLNIPLLVHAELREKRCEALTGGVMTDYAAYLASRPVSMENNAISLLADLALLHGCRVHIVHLAAAGALGIIQEAKNRGAALTVETCPHYLYFDAESIESGQTLFKCAPPIRGRRNNDLLFTALLRGDIDFVATDHSPTIPSAKAIDSGDFSQAWGGIASLQLRLPVMWTLARSAEVSLNDLARWLSQRPAAFLGIEGIKGSISPGCDADLVVWDPESEFVVTPALLHDRHKLTPYTGKRLFGAVKTTYLRGVPVFEEGRFSGPEGRVLLRS